jgi:hypothetical protein
MRFISPHPYGVSFFGIGVMRGIEGSLDPKHLPNDSPGNTPARKGGSQNIRTFVEMAVEQTFIGEVSMIVAVCLEPT